MAVTAVFVELLIIGLGVMCWLTILVAIIINKPIDISLFNVKPILIVPFTAITYVFGVVADRLIRILFGKIENYVSGKRIITHKNEMTFVRRKLQLDQNDYPDITMKLEKFVRANDKELSDKINYNLSRLRICRAWMFHFFVIAISLGFYNWVVFPINYWFIFLVFLFFLLTSFVALQLAKDHKADVIESTRILLLSKESVKN